MSLVKDFKINTVIFTDVFNTYATKDILYDSFNFIINTDDVVTLSIFKELVRNVNMSTTSAINVYVNPHDIFKDTINLFTKPPVSHGFYDHPHFNTVKIFKHPLHNLTIDNRNEIPKADLNMTTLKIIHIDKIWIYNPSISVSQNTDILMQKLIAGPANIDTHTYNTLINEIMRYKHFKILTIIKDPNNRNLCDNKTFSYNKFGLDLTTLPAS
nr:hypothetical protein MmNV_31 [Menippe mercenaria nudivirus]